MYILYTLGRGDGCRLHCGVHTLRIEKDTNVAWFSKRLALIFHSGTAGRKNSDICQRPDMGSHSARHRVLSAFEAPVNKELGRFNDIHVWGVPQVTSCARKDRVKAVLSWLLTETNTNAPGKSRKSSSCMHHGTDRRTQCPHAGVWGLLGGLPHKWLLSQGYVPHCAR